MKDKIKHLVRDTPVIGTVAKKTKTAVEKKLFKGSREYWESRYAKGETSGGGSYGPLAQFKAEVLNDFVKTNGISSVIELGCGDGAQLALADYPSYVGLDVSKTVIQKCGERFADDDTKTFIWYDPESFFDNQGIVGADLALSLDVIYHLIEDRIFELYMAHLFRAAKRYVIVYASDYDERSAAHVRHRKFSEWISANAAGWRFVERLENPVAPGADVEGAPYDFFVYEKIV